MRVYKIYYTEEENYDGSVPLIFQIQPYFTEVKTLKEWAEHIDRATWINISKDKWKLFPEAVVNCVCGHPFPNMQVWGLPNKGSSNDHYFVGVLE